MRVLEVVVPLLFVASAAGLVVTAARDRLATPWDVSRPYLWLIVVIWLTMAGDAAFGENRPVFERTWKGLVAALLAVAFGIDRWRRHRQARAARPDRHPDRRPEPVDG